MVENRNTYPILANVHITAAAGALTLRATDLDIENTISVDAKIESGGITTLPARTLETIVKKYSKDAEVLFETTGDDHMLVKSGRSRFSLATLPPDSFPDLKSGNFSHTFEMTGWDLAASMSKVAFAISTEETRWYLNGIYMRETPDAELLERITPNLETALGRSLDDADRAILLLAMTGLKQRAKTLVELSDSALFYLRSGPLPMNEAALKILTGDARALLGRLLAALSGLNDWTEAALEAEVNRLAESEGLKLGKVAQPLRAALTDRTCHQVSSRWPRSSAGTRLYAGSAKLPAPLKGCWQTIDPVP